MLFKEFLPADNRTNFSHFGKTVCFGDCAELHPDNAFVKQDGTYLSIREPFHSIDGY